MCACDVSCVQARGSVRVCAKKEDKGQPEWFEEAKVFCNGEEVMTVGGTQAEYVVDIWSGNHPFFQGRSSAIMTDAGQVSRFASRFGDLGDLSAVETMDSPAKPKADK